MIWSCRCRRTICRTWYNILVSYGDHKSGDTVPSLVAGGILFASSLAATEQYKLISNSNRKITNHFPVIYVYIYKTMAYMEKKLEKQIA